MRGVLASILGMITGAPGTWDVATDHVIVLSAPSLPTTDGEGITPTSSPNSHCSKRALGALESRPVADDRVRGR